LTAQNYCYNTDTVMTDLIVLAMLLEGPKHGYRLKQEAGTIFGQGELHNNLVYPLLRRFRARGWVTRKTVPGERGQKRQQYALTPLGRRTLLGRVREFSEQEARSADAFRARVGFFGLLAAEDRERILRARADALEQRDQKLATLQKAMKLDVYGSEAVAFMRAQIAVERSWIGRLASLNSKPESRDP
jgi:DNA-binding PadR family transcriptional regulator